MNKRPMIVTIIGCLLVVVGVTGFAYHFNEIKLQNVLHGENVWIFVVELIAILGGVFVLRGKNWARWLALAWMGFHVVISFFDSLQKVAVHVVFFGLIAYSLFRPDARAYFQRQREGGS
jgi:hypothetical protein